METKKCSNCGHELPIKYFQTWVRKDGSIGILHQCLHCQRKEANKRHSDKKKMGAICNVEDEILIKEIERRGFTVKHK